MEVRMAQAFHLLHRIKGTVCFFIGVFLVLVGWTVIGMLVEGFGFVNLFGDFFPFILAFVAKIPVRFDDQFISVPSFLPFFLFLSYIYFLSFFFFFFFPFVPSIYSDCWKYLVRHSRCSSNLWACRTWWRDQNTCLRIRIYAPCVVPSFSLELSLSLCSFGFREGLSCWWGANGKNIYVSKRGPGKNRRPECRRDDGYRESVDRMVNECSLVYW